MPLAFVDVVFVLYTTSSKGCNDVVGLILGDHVVLVALKQGDRVELGKVKITVK